VTLTNLSFLEPKQPWPPKEEKERHDTYEVCEALREGEPAKVWPDLAKYLRQGTTEAQDFYIGFPWLVTKKAKDTILGEPPLFTLPKVNSESNSQDEDLKTFISDLDYRRIIGEQICDLDAFGDAVQKIFIDEDKQIRIESIEPEHWYPVVKRGTRQIEYHVLAFKFEVQEKCYLEVEIHSKKTIEHRVYFLNKSVMGDSSTIGDLQDLAVFHPGLKEIEPNPTGEFLVITSHNQRMSGELYGISSYGKDFRSILEKITIRYSLANNVLDVFSRPTLVGPRNLQTYDPVTGKSVFRPGEYKGVNFDAGVTPFIPQAVTWDGHLTEGRIETLALEEKLFIVAELPPTSLAVNTQGGYASGVAWRLAMTPLIAKCARIREELDASAKKALLVAAKLASKDFKGLNITWQDGLPKIPMEEAQRLGYLVTTGILSPKAAAIEYGKSEEEAQAMVDDMKSSAPSIVQGF
jgi:hypothetical protein